jgi:hypothetical protein
MIIVNSFIGWLQDVDVANFYISEVYTRHL